MKLPIKKILIFIINVSSISISETEKYQNLTEYTSIFTNLYKNALWLLSVLIITLQKSILPYSNVIKYILLSNLNETKYLKRKIDFEIRNCVYLTIKNILPILGPSMYDILYNKLKIYLINDLKCAAKLVLTKDDDQDKYYNMIFYENVLILISTIFDICSDYMLFDEKSEIELILSSTLLSCNSDAGNLLIKTNKIKLFYQFISTLKHVLISPKLYKKSDLTLTKKLLSASFGIGTMLSNNKLINDSQNGLKYIESVINPRSLSVYNNDTKQQQVSHKNNNKKRRFEELETYQEEDEIDDDGDDINIDNDKIEPLWSY